MPVPLIGCRRHVMESGQPILIAGDMGTARLRYGDPKVRQAEPPKSGVFVPQVHEGRGSWVISVHDPDREGAFGASDVNRMTIIAKEAPKSTKSTKSAFLATTIHEIRTPMNGIIRMKHLLSATDLDYDQREYCDMIAESPRRCLPSSKAGRPNIEAVQFDLCDCVEGALGIVAPTL